VGVMSVLDPAVAETVMPLARPILAIKDENYVLMTVWKNPTDQFLDRRLIIDGEWLPIGMVGCVDD
jgi:hypothetical protein